MTVHTDHAEPLLRALAPRVLGALMRRHSDFATAEDAVQEALMAAAWQWPQQGLPDNPGGWLFTVASRRMTDLIRADHARRQRENDAIADALLEQPHVPPPDAGDVAERDDSLLLLFMCCHPSLSPTSAIALTLRAVGGLSTDEIARAFLVPEATMAQRISRAKQTIKKAGASFELPSQQDRTDRLTNVLHVLYLMFNEGYATTAGPSLQRVALSTEAMRLARKLHTLLPDECEVAGLVALMLLTDARRAARTGPNGELIPLDEQDRSLWDRSMIAEGTALILETFAKDHVGLYQLQAAIASLHDEAPDVDATDWRQIFALYSVMLQMSDNPMVALSQAIAAAMVHGPAAGLAMLTPIAADPRVAGTHRVDAVRAHLLEMSGDLDGAVAHYRAAAAKTTSQPERDYLTRKALALATS